MGDVRSLIEKDHGDDKSQLEVIFSDKLKILVEAPAGCGKTKTMVSKIAYILASGKLPANKKILAMTFSVNAAYKIKKDVAEKLPQFGIVGISEPSAINKRMFISNYHGFSRKVLGLYGYLLHPNFKDIRGIKSIDDGNPKNLTELDIGVTSEEAFFMSNFSSAIKVIDRDYIKKHEDNYIDIVLKKLVPNQFITYNAFLMLLYKLLNSSNDLLSFYRKLFPIIIIDEFQDTNYLSWKILNLLIVEKTNLILMGDSLQRIYGFIGAIPNLLEAVEKKYSMHRVFLNKNYRFKDNQNMIYLDRNIRENTYYDKPDIKDVAKVPFTYFNMQEEEAAWVVGKVKYLRESDKDAKIAILFQSRSKNLDIIMTELSNRKVNFFYALFNEDDKIYINFHQTCLEMLFDTFAKSKIKRVNTTFLNTVISKINKQYEGYDNQVIAALLKLIEVFFSNLNTKYSILSDEDKFLFLVDTFENRSLKQNMEFIEDDVIVSTVHGAKGLEWQYVILPDMEQCAFPNYPSLCRICITKHNNICGDFCKINIQYAEKGSELERLFLDILSVFYVAVTRARKQVFLSSSSYKIDNSYTSKKTFISCLLSLPGIEIEQEL